METEATGRRDLAPPPERVGALESRWRDAVLHVETVMLSGGDVDDVLHSVAATARALIDGDVATLGVPRTPGQSLVLRVADGYRADDLRGAIFPVEESLSGHVLVTREPLHVPDATADANAYQPISELGDMGPTLLVPLQRRSEAFGTLLVSRRRGRDDFAEADLELLQLFAGHVAVAVEFCRSQEELRRLAAIEDLERVGRALHDTVVQRLFAAGLTLEGLAARLPPDAGRHLQAVRQQLDDIVRDIRATVLDPSLHQA